MPFFRNKFEKDVNENMQQDISEAGRAPSPLSETAGADMDMKKRLSKSDYETDYETHDSEKKDHPPRFSTLFGTAPPPPPPPRAQHFESYPQSKRRSGIFLPTALFIILVVVLIFESMLLFGYTVIGLYGGLPQRLGGGVTCGQPAAINISPNFMLPMGGQTETVTVSMLPSTSSITSTSTISMASSMTSSSTSSETSTTSNSVVTVTSAAPTSVKLVTASAEAPSTVNSVQMITVDSTGGTLPTVTSTQVIQASALSSAESSVQAVLSSLVSDTVPDAVPTTTPSASLSSTGAPFGPSMLAELSSLSKETIANPIPSTITLTATPTASSSTTTSA